MADVSPDQTDGLKKVYENSLGLCGFSKAQVSHAIEAQTAANPALAKFLPKLTFSPVAGATPDVSSMNHLPGMPGDIGGAFDPTGITGMFAQFMQLMMDSMSQFPDAEQLLDPAIAGEVAEEAAKKLI